MSTIGSVSGGGYNRVQYPVYAGGTQNLSKCTYKVGETATSIHNGPNLITMSNADGDTVTLSEAAQKAMQLSSHHVSVGSNSSATHRTAKRLDF